MTYSATGTEAIGLCICVEALGDMAYQVAEGEIVLDTQLLGLLCLCRRSVTACGRYGSTKNHCQPSWIVNKTQEQEAPDAT